MNAVAYTELPLKLWRRGKVRDVYEVDARAATPRRDGSRFGVRCGDERDGAAQGIRAHADHGVVVAATGRSVAPPHVEREIDEIVGQVPVLRDSRDMLAGRAMLCRRTDVFPVECVVRGYIAGSAWKEYSASGTLAGEPLPAGLLESSKLEKPIFSPATKAESGHDENITRARMASMVGGEMATKLEAASLRLYEFGNRSDRTARHHHCRYEVRVRVC